MSFAERRSVVEEAVLIEELEGLGMRVEVLDAVLFQRGRLGSENGLEGWGAMISGWKGVE